MKTKSILIFGGLAILIIGLATGAYFFFQTRDKEWRNDAGQLHREDDQPAVINYDANGEIESEAWYLNGELYRENDRPSWIVYDANGEIESEAWYLNGELIKENPPSM